MQSTLKTLLLAGAASLALAFAAQAGDLDEAADAVLSKLTTEDTAKLTDSLPTPIKDAVEAAATEAAVESLIDALDD